MKILSIDQQDYEASFTGKDTSLADFIRETSVLSSLRDSKVKNINHIFEAFDFDSDLFIVCEYCPGGSLSTLLRPCHTAFKKEMDARQDAISRGIQREELPVTRGIPEPFIIAIAREVAIAVKAIHEAGVIHRDIKCKLLLTPRELV